MDQRIIKEKVKEIYQYLNNYYEKGTFEYNPECSELLDKLYDLRSQCSHTYNNGECIFCKKSMLEDIQ